MLLLSCFPSVFNETLHYVQIITISAFLVLLEFTICAHRYLLHPGTVGAVRHSWGWATFPGLGAQGAALATAQAGSPWQEQSWP